MTKVKDVISAVEVLAPPAYQEDYDNAGLIVGSPDDDVTGVLLALDTTEEVIEEAVRRHCNLIIAHHPIIFRGLKKLNGKNYVERTIINAVRYNIAIYAAHTNLDHVQAGVNRMIADKLGLRRVKVLEPKKRLLSKLTFFTPVDQTGPVLNALYEAGAGQIGEYSDCSFSAVGIGTFTPSDQANPTIGRAGEPELVNETRTEVMFPAFLENKIVDTLRRVHPYEEVAYYLTRLENENQEVGAGAVGELPAPLPAYAFLAMLKRQMQLTIIRHTDDPGRLISRVAVCGGAGSFLLQAALRAGADAFVTADYKYHEFFDAEGRLMICDIGHYESEVYTKNLLYNYLSDKFSNFALCLSEVNTNPVRYFV